MKIMREVAFICVTLTISAIVIALSMIIATSVTNAVLGVDREGNWYKALWIALFSAHGYAYIYLLWDNPGLKRFARWTDGN